MSGAGRSGPRGATLALSSGQGREDEGIGVRLLADIQTMLDLREDDRIALLTLLPRSKRTKRPPGGCSNPPGFGERVLAIMDPTFRSLTWTLDTDPG